MERIHVAQLRHRFSRSFRAIQVLYGPRQVGKTTAVLQLCKQLGMPYNYVSADALGSAATQWLHQQWDTALLKQKSLSSADFLLVVDEVQKIPNWSETIKDLWDAERDNPGFRLLLLGSSRLLLQQGLTESLAGRIENLYMGHWSRREMHDAFGMDAEQYAWFGGYPGSVGLLDDELRWKNYVRDSLIETSISKDVLMLTRIDKPALLRRLFELGCLYSSQELSFTKILGQLQDAGNTVTLAHYLKTLDSAGFLAGLQKYAVDNARLRSAPPKFLVHNTAFVAAQHAYTFEEARSNPEFWGRVVESAVGSHLLQATVGSRMELYHWRQGAHEVDYVLKLGERIVAIEVKTNRDKAGKGMQQFVGAFAPHRTYLVGGSGIPWQEFLGIDPASLF